ncbi:MAG TPA: cytochrome o ubiquinol oxidase subunit IV [Sphingomonas sp.]|nr:cytochrome o ubiquinol oxidase subunit IV [Sphingomonas sp.]
MNDQADASDRNDAAPGEDTSGGHGAIGGVSGYTIGLGLSALLTIGSFMTVGSSLVWAPAIPAALIALAIAQMGVHLVFFLHTTSGPDNTNNLIALTFGVFVVGLMLFGSIWIMDHLNHNMMPMTAAHGAQHGGFKSPL